VGYISSGVIQGSCLGPLLFLLYINDLVDVFPDKVVIKLYADDVKLYSNITTTMIDTTFKLQDQLDKLAEWASVWQLPISYSKCCAITVGRGIRHFQQQSYAIDEHVIQSVSSVVDLGVTVNNNLKFALHINNVCCKAHRRANLLLRCFQSKNVESLVSAFKVYVRPIIEYCSVVWNPCLLKDIKTIETVQRKFTKRLPGMKTLSYHQRLVKLGLESLELRRLRADLLFTYKLVFGITDLKLSDFFTPNFHRTSRRHRYQLYLPTCKNSIRSNSYPYRVLSIWNELSPHETNFNSIATFKSSLTSEQLLRHCKVNFI